MLLRLATAVIAPIAMAMDEDIFLVKGGASPRERAIAQELHTWANASDAPWLGRRVVAAMTTTPRRIWLLEPALDSLLAQTYPLDAIYLFVPHYFRRDGTTYELPAWLPSKRGVTVVRSEDHGPITHMLEVLRTERDPQTFLLQVDDDQRYGPQLLESLLRATGPLPGRVIGAASQHAHSHLSGVILEGVHGVLFQRKFFDASVFEYDDFPAACRLHDDLWLSAHLAKRRVRREIMGSRFAATPLNFGFGADALYKGGAGSDNNENLYRCNGALLRTDPHLWQPEDRVVVAAPLLPGFSRGRPGEARNALRRLKTSFQRSPKGPQTLYLMGPPARDLCSDRIEDVRISGGCILRLGSWAEGVDVIVQDCGEATGVPCGMAQLTKFVLSMEEDPETVLLFLEKPIKHSVQNTFEAHMKCHAKRAYRIGKEMCHELGGFSFRRHTAYPEGRIPSGLFLPIFGSHFHDASIDGRHMVDGQNLFFRDEGPWRVDSSERHNFGRFIRSGMDDPRIVAMWQQMFDQMPRLVAALGVARQRLRFLGATIRSLLQQQPPLQRIYVFVRGCGARQRMVAPGWLRSRPRVRVVCSSVSGPEAPVVDLLALERHPTTLVLLCDSGYKYGRSLLGNLLRAALAMWQGSAVGCSGSIKGGHGGPIPDVRHGVLLQRSFINTRIIDLFEDPCGAHLSMALAAHLESQGIRSKVIGNSFGTRRIPPSEPRPQQRSLCYAELVRRYQFLWNSYKPERCVLYVALLDGTDDFLLDLTVRYAGLQTRKPDVLVLLVSAHSTILSRRVEDSFPGDAELHVTGAVGDGTARVRTRRGEAYDVPLSSFLASLRDGVGTVVRMHSGSGPPRGFALEVMTCSDTQCAVQPTLGQTFERELDPQTALMFTSAERLVSERLVEETLGCLSACAPRCTSQNWCGQSSSRKDGALYDFTIRRSAGYLDYNLG